MKKIKQWIRKHKFFAAAAFTAVIILVIVRGFRHSGSDEGTLSDPLRKGPILESVYGIGTVTATRSFQLKTGVTSTIRRLFVKEGDFVSRGSRLVDLEGTTLFTAPFSGTVTSLPFKVGETVFAQSVILSLVDLQDRYIIVSLEQQAAIRVRRGQKAKVSFDSMRGESYDGLVESVYSNDNNFLVRINVDGLPPQILPGMTADVAVGIEEHKDALLVPVAAIHDGKVTVRRQSGASETVAVRTGIVDGAMAEAVSSDLRGGDRVLIRKKVGP